MYAPENGTKVDNLGEFFRVAKENKETGEAYNKYSLPTLYDFLETTYERETDVNKMEGKVILMDRCYYDLYHIFAEYHLIKGYTTEEEFAGYKRKYWEGMKDVVSPDLFIYLHAQTDILVDRVSARNRDYEEDIDVEFIADVSYRYKTFFSNTSTICGTADVLIIDTSYVTREQVLEIAKEYITKKLAELKSK